MKKAVRLIILSVIIVVVLVLNTENDYDVMLNGILSFEINSPHASEKVDIWQDDEGVVFVFLPSYARLESVIAKKDDGAELILNGMEIFNNMNCGMFEYDVLYELIFNGSGNIIKYDMMFIQSSDVATIFIDTESGNMKHIHLDKKNRETGEIRVYETDGTLNYSGKMETIKGRGNSTWSDFEKKPYKVTLLEDADLLGLGAAKNWILLANSYDHTHVRNKIVYEFAKDLGLEFSPDSIWVEIYLNGEYAGLYLLSEQNEVHSERVAIGREDSFLVSVEAEDKLAAKGDHYEMTKAGQALKIHYAASEVDVMGILQSVENAILSENGIDIVSNKDWTELIDVDSWVYRYIIDELFANTDGGATSQFYYMNGASKENIVYSGPVWDYDASSGAEVWWQINTPFIYYVNRHMVREGKEVPWFSSLYQKEEFYKKVINSFREECIPLVNEYLSARIWNYAMQIIDAAHLDAIRWEINTDYKAEIDYLILFLNERIAFLQELWLSGKEFHYVTVYPGNDMHYLYYPIEDENSMRQLPVLKDTDKQRFVGWFYVDTNEPLNEERPVMEDIEIYAMWSDKRSKIIDRIIVIMPIASIAFIGGCILLADIRRIRKGG